MRMPPGTIVLRMKGIYISAKMRQGNPVGSEILLEKTNFY